MFSRAASHPLSGMPFVIPGSALSRPEVGSLGRERRTETQALPARSLAPPRIRAAGRSPPPAPRQRSEAPSLVFSVDSRPAAPAPPGALSAFLYTRVPGGAPHGRRRTLRAVPGAHRRSAPGAAPTPFPPPPCVDAAATENRSSGPQGPHPHLGRRRLPGVQPIQAPAQGRRDLLQRPAAALHELAQLLLQPPPILQRGRLALHGRTQPAEGKRPNCQRRARPSGGCGRGPRAT